MNYIFFEFMIKKHFSVDLKTNSINLLDKQDNSNPTGKKIFKFSKIFIYIALILIVSFFIFSYQVLFTGNSMIDSLSGKMGFFKQLTTIAKGESELQGMEEDRINILLLGNGGIGHDGPNLTDTIIVASLQPSTKKISMISIPRDLLVEIPDYGWWKINNANHFGETKLNNQGGQLASQVVSNIIGQPIHYFIRVDFAGFEQLIDDLGGVKIDVENSFIDYQYPTFNYKYQVVSFQEGTQTMDGETALKYVRSRHGNNGEGSDFARSKRQQKLLEAVKDRVLSYKTFLNPSKINKILKNLNEHVSTNLELNEISELAKLVRDADTQNIITQVLDDSADGYLYSSIVNEAYVLIPKGNDYSAIQFMAQNIFSSQHLIENKQSAKLEIKNGTTINGLAYQTSQKLKTLGFKILKIGNAPQQEQQQTIIYDLTESSDSSIDEILETQLNGQVTTEIPGWVREDADLSTEYYIILGQDANT